MYLVCKPNSTGDTDVMSSWRRLLEIAEPHGHFVQFYGSDDRTVIKNAGFYLREGLRRGESAVVIGTGAHTQAFVEEFQVCGVEVESFLSDGKLVLLDAQPILAGLMGDDQLKP